MSAFTRESTKSVLASVVVTLAVLIVAAGFLVAHRQQVFTYFAESTLSSRVAVAGAASAATSTKQASTDLFTEQGFVEGAVAKANPAVVSVVITKDVPVVQQYYQQLDPFGGMFGNDPFQIQIPQYKQNGTQKQEVGGGSGFFVSSDGLIVTNKHVVSDTGAQYTVFTNDGKKYDATVVARDPAYDIALLRVKGSGFPYLRFGSSDNLKLGQTVIAIGNALGEFRNTVSRGVVSGLGRSIVAGDPTGSSEQLDEVIQTDAAINPGNSGGPLLDLSGNVVGVDVAVAQGSQSIGFALPASIAASAVASVEKTGEIVRPYLGVRYLMINKDIQQKNNLSVDYGALVTPGQNPGELAVIPGSPADKAGIVENDIILQVDSASLKDGKTLATEIHKHKVGDKVTLVVLHKGKKETLTATLTKENSK